MNYIAFINLTQAESVIHLLRLAIFNKAHNHLDFRGKNCLVYDFDQCFTSILNVLLMLIPSAFDYQFTFLYFFNLHQQNLLYKLSKPSVAIETLRGKSSLKVRSFHRNSNPGKCQYMAMLANTQLLSPNLLSALHNYNMNLVYFKDLIVLNTGNILKMCDRPLENFWLHKVPIGLLKVVLILGLVGPSILNNV